MPPLAHRILRQKTLPVDQRHVFLEGTNFAKNLADAACFEMTAVAPMIQDIAKKFREGGIDGTRAFLPSPKTWIELQATDLVRIGYALHDTGDGRAVFTRCIEARYEASVYPAEARNRCVYWPWMHDEPGQSLMSRTEFKPKSATLPLHDDLDDSRVRRALALDASNSELTHLTPFEIYAALAIINTPRLIGRTQRAPHRGLERNLLRNQKAVGSYPLRAWSEITLSATPSALEDGETEEVHFTGKKCLHFCRAHLRVRNGRLELVNAHWRGDPALGIKRTRYKVVH